jgi:hypothetical protein
MANAFWNKLTSGLKRFAKGFKTMWTTITPIVETIAPAVTEQSTPGLGAVVSADRALESPIGH